MAECARFENYIMECFYVLPSIYSKIAMTHHNQDDKSATN